MTLFVLTPETVWNPDALNVNSAPRKFVDRIAILPRQDATWVLILRLIVEYQFLRFAVALSPFGVAMLVWPSLALPIAQAPVLMLALVAFAELRVLRTPREKRARFASEAEAASALDALAFRARSILSQIAARRGRTSGELLLVVDQSELTQMPPLTIVSVQCDPRGGEQAVLTLDDEERRLIHETLFDNILDERRLHRANLSQDEFMRTVAFDSRGVTARARLAAILERPAEEKTS